MKLLINEKQIKDLVNQIVDQEIDEQDLADQDASSGEPKTGTSDSQGTGSEGYPSSTTKWEDVRSPLSQGVANPSGPIKKRHTDYSEAEPTRSVGNQLQ